MMFNGFEKKVDIEPKLHKQGGVRWAEFRMLDVGRGFDWGGACGVGVKRCKYCCYAFVPIERLGCGCMRFGHVTLLPDDIKLGFD